MPLDKRSATRSKKRLTVRYGTERPSNVGFTRDISSSGAFLQARVVVPPGTELQIVLEIAERTFALKGVVAWAKDVPPRLAHLLDCGMGVRFVEVPDDFRDFFDQWEG